MMTMTLMTMMTKVTILYLHSDPIATLPRHFAILKLHDTISTG